MTDLNADQFSTVLPAGHPLLHVTSNFRLPDIKAQGLHPSSDGESGPGVYTTPDPKFAERMHQGRVSEAGPYGHTLQLATTKPLRLLDRTKPGGEEEYRRVQQEHGRAGTAQGLAKAGYHGVNYKSGGKQDHEVVIHDPKHLKVTHWGDA